MLYFQVRKKHIINTALITTRPTTGIDLVSNISRFAGCPFNTWTFSTAILRIKISDAHCDTVVLAKRVLLRFQSHQQINTAIFF